MHQNEFHHDQNKHSLHVMSILCDYFQRRLQYGRREF